MKPTTWKEIEELSKMNFKEIIDNYEDEVIVVDGKRKGMGDVK